MTIQEIVDWIRHWECFAGESFHDYFTHDTVEDEDWLPFLREKGFNERADEIVEDSKGHSCCLDQHLLYDIYSYEKWNEEDYQKDLALMAEFFLRNPQYYGEFQKFMAENPVEND